MFAGDLNEFNWGLSHGLSRRRTFRVVLTDAEIGKSFCVGHRKSNMKSGWDFL